MSNSTGIAARSQQKKTNRMPSAAGIAARPPQKSKPNVRVDEVNAARE